MAQPLAQAPENLVALDDWVRGGGRVLLLADPMLEWPSKRPLGDPLRPPPMFADTGLARPLGSCGSTRPTSAGPATGSLAGRRVVTVSPGALFGSCAISADRLVARLPHRQGQGDGRRRCRLPERRAVSASRRRRQSRRAAQRACQARVEVIRDSRSHRLIHRAHRPEQSQERKSNFCPRKNRRIPAFPCNPIKSHKNPLYPARALSYQHRL